MEKPFVMTKWRNHFTAPRMEKPLVNTKWRNHFDEVCNFPIETKARITLQTLFLRSTTKNYMYTVQLLI